MKISKIYTEYKIMPSLQIHQYRVAAVAKMICDNFRGDIDEEYIISACLLHDMGNILKFDLELYPKFLEPEGLGYWQSIKEEFEEKYGKDEHEATLEIAKELDVTLLTYDLIDSIGFSKLEETLMLNNFARKIASYADTRVTPHGITSMEERMREGAPRFEKNKKEKSNAEILEKQIEICKKLEKQIFDKCKIKPEDINDSSAKSFIGELKQFEII